MLALAAVTALLLGPVPANADRWAREDPSLGPLEVCHQLVQAARDEDWEGVLGRSTAYTRAHLGKSSPARLRAARQVLVGARCVRVLSQTETVALVWVFAPQGKSREVPFLRENGVWRLDQERYERPAPARPPGK